MYTDLLTAIGAATTNTTSSGIAVSKRRLMSIQFIAKGVSSGNGVFKVQFSQNNADWTDYKRLTSNVTNTNSQTDTRVQTVTLSATGSDFVFFPAGDHTNYIRVSCHVTTDGSYTAILHTVG